MLRSKCIEIFDCVNLDQTRSQTIGAFAGASIGEILVPQKDTLSNRIVSFIANQIFASDIVPQLNDVRFYLWTRFESKLPVLFHMRF